jgi:hypothetical protein
MGLNNSCCLWHLGSGEDWYEQQETPERSKEAGEVKQENRHKKYGVWKLGFRLKKLLIPDNQTVFASNRTY